MDKAQVLIVEDEAIVSMDLRYNLEALGYSVVAETRSGEEAVEAASRLHPDVVLMDIGLSGEMDGIDAAAQIRGQFDIPVVYLTAYIDETTSESLSMPRPWGHLNSPSPLPSLPHLRRNLPCGSKTCILLLSRSDT